MFGKIIGAAVGSKVAQQTKGMAGATGAMIGAAAPFILRRMSIPAILALGVGGYVAKKYLDKSKTERPEPAGKQTAPVASIPQPEAA